MLKIRTLLLSLLACALLAGSFGAVQALASQGQTTYFEGSALLLNPVTRHHAIEQLQHLGVKALRVELKWSEVAPGPTSTTKPNFEASNPGSYNWGAYATLLAEAKQLGWPVLLTVTAPAPRWATSNHQAPYITRPDPEDFEDFMTAVARAFGSEVSIYAIWNEPNEPVFLMPQWNSNGTPASGRIYRSLYQAGYAGLKAAGLVHPRVLFGETAPAGYDTVNVRKEGSKAALHHPVAPLAFMREALCLNAKYKKAGSCSELQVTGYGHHAYTLPAGPYSVPKQRDDVTIGALSRLSSALNLAAHARAIPANVPIYLTEFGVQSFPNKYLGVSAANQAEYDAISEHIAYEDPHVAAFSQYLLKDDPVGGAEPEASFQTGLEYVNGTLKPLYYGWPVPLTVTQEKHGVALWGLVRPATGATKVTILFKAKHAKRYKTLRTTETNSRGYWSFNSTTAAEDWRVRWTSPKGVKYEGPPISAYKAP
jgi:Cellulase (glycosyl hydrolase family 5)